MRNSLSGNTQKVGNGAQTRFYVSWSLSYLLSTQSPTFQDILIFSLIFIFQMLGEKQVTDLVTNSQALPTPSLCR